MSEFRIKKIICGTVTGTGDFTYVPIRGTVTIFSGKDIEFNTVIFIKKNKSHMEILNFPFLEPRLPNWLFVVKLIK